MTEQTETVLDALKAKATVMGISFHPSIGEETLRTKIETREVEVGKQESGVSRADLRKQATKLHRVIVTCMNPSKKDWPGEVFKVGNPAIGMVGKYIPFDKEYHVPDIILQEIKSRKYPFSYLSQERNVHGDKIRKIVEKASYGIQALPPLSEDELKELAEQQKARRVYD